MNEEARREAWERIEHVKSRLVPAAFLVAFCSHHSSFIIHFPCLHPSCLLHPNRERRTRLPAICRGRSVCTGGCRRGNSSTRRSTCSGIPCRRWGRWWWACPFSFISRSDVPSLFLVLCSLFCNPLPHSSSSCFSFFQDREQEERGKVQKPRRTRNAEEGTGNKEQGTRNKDE